MLLLLVSPCQGGSYSQKKALHDALLSSSNYNPDQRPVLDQAHTLHVDVMFALVSIVEINDVIQNFRCNGFLGLFWTDEILRWNSSDYGGEVVMAPKITSVFRPRVIMLNTMENRDLFEDDYAPLSVMSDGSVDWAPGSIFPASCKLDLTKYPFDQQHCQIEMLAMNFNATELLFQPTSNFVGMNFFTENGQWDITNMSVSCPLRDIGSEQKSTVLVSFDLKRKPTFLVLSVLLPIVFLSLLNLLVFVIPVDSGEKISYGITVLLALSVFMSIMSSMLPSSSESMPLMISYIFILMIISVLTVVDSIIIVGLHHMEEKEEKSQKARTNFKSAMPKIGFLRKAVTPLNQTSPMVSEDPINQDELGLKVKPVSADDRTSPEKSAPPYESLTRSSEGPRVNKYKLIGKYIDLVSLAVFGVVWLSVTVGFMASMAA
ncbi:hypothetical protein EGW08_002321 [Elysia chlorotica]|uniref:Neurotransmitter-gated ion-channel ligand-binding domain-containing protein n=1 Tax=Elysia chlorotica TaxID=188477 RepID=A0A433U7U6_ELYCH|nr:hypothetical protein EGW08_002321 [Elysia chlorotica]